MMLATEVLIAHHNEIRALFDRLAASPPDRHGDRRRVLDALMIELELHEQIEDEIFYPAVADVSTLVPLGHAEHRQLGDQLAVLLRTDPTSEQFLAELGRLRALLEHHGGLEEEDRMFPEVVAGIDAATLSRLGEQLESRLQHLRRSRLVAARLAVKRGMLRHLAIPARG